MTTKFDRKAAMRSTLTQEKAHVADRFAAAEVVMTDRPAGLAVAAGPVFRAESGDDHQSKQYLRVGLALIDDNPFNARHIYEPEKIAALAASIATQGQLTPALAVRHPSKLGHFRLIDGHYRKKALVGAGKTHIDITVVDQVSDADHYKLSWVANEQRSAQSALDNAISWQKLLDDGVVKEREEIAEMLGLTPSAITKTLALLKLPLSTITRIRERPQKFGVAIGYELSQCAKRLDEQELLVLVQRIIDEDWSSRELEAFRNKLENGPQRKPTEVSRQYKIRAGQAQIGVIKEWDSGKIALEVTLMDPRQRVELLDELKRRFHLEDSKN